MLSYLVLCLSCTTLTGIEALPTLRHVPHEILTWEYRDTAHPDEFVSESQATVLDKLGVADSLAILTSGKACEAVYILNAMTRPGPTIIRNYRILLDAACPPRAGAILQTVAAGLSMTLSNEPGRDEAVDYFLQHLRKMLDLPSPHLSQTDIAHIAFDCACLGFHAFIEDRAGIDATSDLIMDAVYKANDDDRFTIIEYLWSIAKTCPRLHDQIYEYSGDLAAHVAREAGERLNSDQEGLIGTVNEWKSRQNLMSSPPFEHSQKEFEELLAVYSESWPNGRRIRSRHEEVMHLRNEGLYERFSEHILYASKSNNDTYWLMLEMLRYRPESPKRRQCVDMLLTQFESCLADGVPNISHTVIARLLDTVCPAMMDSCFYKTYPTYGCERALAICTCLFGDADREASEMAIKSALIALPRIPQEPRQTILNALCPLMVRQKADGTATQSVLVMVDDFMKDHPEILTPEMLK